MAILAGDAVELVLRPVKQDLILARDVTIQASGGVVGRLCAKAEYASPGCRQLLIVSTSRFNSFNVRLAWPMTTLAPGAVRHVLCRRAIMYSLRKLVPLQRMTAHACFRSGVVRRLSLGGRLPDD